MREAVWRPLEDGKSLDKTWTDLIAAFLPLLELNPTQVSAEDKNLEQKAKFGHQEHPTWCQKRIERMKK